MFIFVFIFRINILNLFFSNPYSHCLGILEAFDVNLIKSIFLNLIGRVSRRWWLYNFIFSSG